MTRALSSSAARAVVLSAALLASGCIGTTEPESSGGQPVPGTELATCPNDTGVFLSPDGRFLVFEVADVSAPDYVAFASADWAVLDVAAREVRPVAVAPDVQALVDAAEGPMAAGACWGSEGRSLFLRGPARGAWFTLAASAPGPTLSTAHSPPQCTASAAEEARAGAAVRIERRAPRHVDIVRLTGEVLAQHRTAGAGSTRIDVRYPRLSPDGRFLSYLVTEGQGSFASPSRAYLLELAAAPGRPPRLLAAPVFGPPVWSPNFFLYACTAGGGDSPRIVRWDRSTINRQDS